MDKPESLIPSMDQSVGEEVPEWFKRLMDVYLAEISVALRSCYRLLSSTANSGWISVNDRLPDHNQNIIFVTTGFSNNGMEMGVFQNKDEFGRDNMFIGEGFISYNRVSHWMPTPAPPVSPSTPIDQK